VNLADLVAPKWNSEISRGTLEGAVEMGEYFLAHAKAAFAAMGADPALEDAKRIVRWLSRREDITISRRDIRRRMGGRFDRAEALDAPLAILVRQGYLRPLEIPDRPGPGRKPGQVYEVNPLWRRNFEEAYPRD